MVMVIFVIQPNPIPSLIRFAGKGNLSVYVYSKKLNPQKSIQSIK